MDTLTTMSEVIGHLAVVAAFVIVAVYVTIHRRVLRRTTRRATIVYWLIFAGSIFFAAANVLRLIEFATIVKASGPLPWYDLVAEYLSVIGQSVIVVVLIGLKVVSDERSDRPRRILAIGAHPDDIEIACGATLAQFHDSGYTIWGLVITQGERGGNSDVRPAEAIGGAHFLGLDHVKILDFPDTRLQECSGEILEAIEAMLREYNPDMVFTHSSHDLHQDHRAVHEATLRAARNLGTVFCYESPSVTQEFLPAFFVDIGNYIDVKVESIKEHWDQRAKPYVQEERVRGQAVFRGGQAKTRYAEGFEVVRAVYSSMGYAP
jgi:LmbE family N-acetylglucosaminyl deacetylase